MVADPKFGSIIILTVYYLAGRMISLDVISTDYDNYACVVACDNVIDTHYAVFAWILNRKPNFNKKVVRAEPLIYK